VYGKMAVDPRKLCDRLLIGLVSTSCRASAIGSPHIASSFA
jgi:hypothetical protein